MFDDSPSMFQDPTVRGKVGGLADCHKGGSSLGVFGDVDEANLVRF